MKGKYSFYCKGCGDTFEGSKEEVQEYSKHHKVRIKGTIHNGFKDASFCPLETTKNNTLARPALAKIINKRI